MQLFQKINDQCHAITPQALLNHTESTHILFDPKSDCHILCLVKTHEEEKQLFRFPLRQLNGVYTPLPVCFRYDATKDIFLTTPINQRIEHPLPLNSFLTPKEINALHEDLNKGLTLQTDIQEYDWYNESAALTKDQQRQLALGQVTQVPCQSFYQYLKSHSLHQLEAAIRADNIDDLNLSAADEIELKAFRYAYLNPVTINLFRLPYSDETHPTAGEIYDYYVEVIKRYIIQQNPERAEKLLHLRHLAAAYTTKIGNKTAEFKDEGIYNPDGLTYLEDILFRYTALIIGARPDELQETIYSILATEDLRDKCARLQFLVFLNILVKKEPISSEQTAYTSVIISLEAAYPGLLNDISQLQEGYHCLWASLDRNELQCFLEDESKQWPDYIVHSVTLLAKANLLTKDNLKATIAHQHFELSVKILTILQDAGILTQNNLYAVSKYRYPHYLANALKSLQQVNLLTQDNRNAVIQHPTPYDFAKDLASLYKDQSLNAVRKVTRAVKAFQQYITHIDNQPHDWKEKGETLYQFTLSAFYILQHPQNRYSETEKAHQLAKKVYNKAQQLWGLDYKAGRIVLDTLLILLSFAGVGLALMGIKKATTGHAFFFFGKQKAQAVLTALEQRLLTAERLNTISVS